MTSCRLQAEQLLRRLCVDMLFLMSNDWSWMIPAEVNWLSIFCIAF